MHSCKISSVKLKVEKVKNQKISVIGPTLEQKTLAKTISKCKTIMHPHYFSEVRNNLINAVKKWILPKINSYFCRLV